jgi:PAS domain S-box-containing protein
MDAVNSLFSSSGFMPHGHCFLWTPALLWSYVLADGAIALAYYSIPAALWYLTRRRRDMPFNWVFLMFSGFIFACGTTHLLAILNIWEPVYWLDASVKAVTAAISVATAALLWPLIPKAVALPSPAQLARVNADLQAEIARRAEAESMLQAVNRRLEERVAERTSALQIANQQLSDRIAERDRADLARRESEQLLQSIADNALAVIYVKDLDGRYLLVNRQFEEAFRIPQELAKGKTDFDLFPAEVAESARARERAVVEANAPVVADTVAAEEDGVHEFLSVKFPIRDAANQVYAVGGIATDITERKRVEKELMRANENLREFTHVASHDLRSPLRGIADLVEWVREDLGENPHANVVRNLARISERVKRLDQLITDLLRYARSEQIDGDFSLVDFAVLVRDILLIDPPPSGMSVGLAARPAPIWAPRTPIETVLRNLIANAIKHHDRTDGRISIDVVSEGGFVRVTVTDDGPGIPDLAQQRVFRLFQTAGMPGRAGSGLGLALAKRLVEIHGGRIELLSPVVGERGSQFRFWWPHASSGRAQ